MFHSIGKFIRTQTPKLGRLHASLVVVMAEKALAEMFGAERAANMKVRSFRDGTLKISCVSSVLSEEIRLQEEELRSRINGTLGRETIRRILPTG